MHSNMESLQFFRKKSVKLNRHDDSFSVCHVGKVVTQYFMSEAHVNMLN